MILRVACLVMLGFLSAGCSCIDKPSERPQTSPVSVISLDAVYKAYRKSDRIFVDARPSQEYKEKHIPTAISIPFEAFEQHFDLLDDIVSQPEPVIVYCSNRDCDEAMFLSQVLWDIGKTNVYYFKDGFSAWNQAGYPAE